MNALAKHEETLPAKPPVSEATAMIQMIERVALTPGVDIDKLERLMAMHERMRSQAARTAYDEALSAMQPQLPAIDERGRIEVREKDNQGKRTGDITQATSYAKWADINDVIKPILGAHGFALSFRRNDTADGKIGVTGILSHAGGHREETTVTLMHDSTGSKNAVQAVGSSISYGQRYAAKMLLNITSRSPQDRDDDGTAAGNATITEEQAIEIREMADNVGADIVAFCRWLNVEEIAVIPASKYEAAIKGLQAKAKRR